MKNFKVVWPWLLILIISVSSNKVSACDVCGCGAGGVFMGMMPQYKKFFTGVRYQYRGYQSHLGSATGLLRTTENFHSAEWYGGMRVGGRVQVMAFLPYQWHQQQSLDTRAQISGLGDVSVMSTIQVWETAKTNKKNNMQLHTLQLGGGLKLPTGNWQFEEGDAVGQHANFMPGTGSVDALALALYQYLSGNMGVSASAMYQLKTANSNGFKFGDRVQLAAQSFYKWKVGKNANLSPNAGFLVEAFAQDQLNKEAITPTGGWIVNGLLGAEYSIEGIAVGMVMQPPVAQSLNDGEVKNTFRGMLYFTVVL